MTIYEAISELSDCAYMGSFTTGDKFRDACRLGIEALKKINAIRELVAETIGDMRPGETPPPEE